MIVAKKTYMDYSTLMSIECLNWCIKQKCATPSTKLVLFVLSNYSDEKHSCYPSEKKLAEIVGVSERQIRRCLHWLEENKYITIQPRAGTSNRYFMRVDMGVQRGGHTLPEGGGHGSPPILKKDTKANTKEKSKGNTYTKEFEIFWSVYPRKIGKYGAFKSYEKVSKEHPHKLILERAKIFCKNNEMTEERFIPHCTTWLNQRRFLDVEVKTKKKTSLNSLAG